MKTPRPRVVVTLAVIGLFLLSGIALAATDGDKDTVFNYGYDQDSQFFMWNVTSLDYQPNQEALAEALADDNTLTEGEFTALLEACGLEATDAPTGDGVGYTYTYDPDSGEVTVDTPEGYQGECGPFQGGEVTGPAGQVNHGMFLKLFNQLYDGEHHGCLVSEIAGSGLGKGPQKVKANSSDGATSGEIVEPAAETTISFTTAQLDCQHGPDRGDGDQAGRGGPPQKVKDKFGGQHPKDSKGKSGQAPGHNK